jgi:hypothetical protein
VSWPEEVITAAHLRTPERGRGRSCPRVQDTDLSGLRLLRDRLGERFLAGFLLTLGELAYHEEERIMVMPLSGLWS